MRSLVQNPLDGHDEPESDRNKAMRGELWNALKKPTKPGILVKPGTIIMEM